MQKSGWSSRTYFDGGHAKNAAEAAAATKNQNQDFTASHFNQAMTDLKTEIKSGRFTSGDQIYLQISTHGEPAEAGEFTHKVRGVDSAVDLSGLRELRDLAEAKGIHLAIVDMSCHSGATQALATDKTCVVSMAGDNLAYNGDAENFSARIAAGRSLEDVFLGGRSANSSPGFPQISSPAGRQVAQMFRDVEKNNDYFTDILHRECVDATATDSFKKLMKNLDALEKEEPTRSFYGLRYWGSGAAAAKSDLITKVRAYQDLRRETLRAFARAQEADRGLCLQKHPGVCIPYSRLRALSDRLRVSGAARAELGEYEKAMQSSDYRKWERSYADYAAKIKKLKGRAGEVGKEEREVYSMMYKKLSAADQGPNPCKEFVF